MKQLTFCVVLGLLWSTAVWGGELYGTITEGGKALKEVKVEVQAPSKPSAVTDAFGAYRLFVPEQGKFKPTVDYGGQTPSLDVFSYDRSVRYDLLLEKKGAGYAVRRK